MKELLAKLQKLGLSQYESRAYVALLKSPQVTAYELAKQSGIPPSKIYEVVEKLLVKELVVTVEEGGFAHYVPMDPHEAIGRYRRSYAETLDFVEDQLEHYYTKDHGGAAYVRSLVNAADIMAKTVEMVTSAAEVVYLACWPQELPRIADALRKADAAGVRIAVCMYGDDDVGVGIVYHHATDDIVLRDQGARRMVLVVDHREALIAYFPENGDATAHWSENIGFIQMTKDYIRHDIWVIKVMNRFEELMTETYGPNRELLRDVFASDPSEVRAAPRGAAR